MNPFERRDLMTERSCSSFPAKRVSVYPVLSTILWFLPGRPRWVVIGVPDLGVREGVVLAPLIRAGVAAMVQLKRCCKSEKVFKGAMTGQCVEAAIPPE